MRGKSNHIRINRKSFFSVLFVFILAIATPVLAGYLGPNRTVAETTSVCKVVLYECQHVPSKDLWKYKRADDWSCSNEGKPWQSYPSSPSSQGCFDRTAGDQYWEEEETLQQVTTTHPSATISGALQNCNVNNGWCNTASNLSLLGNEPLSGYNILAVEGILNGQSFACSGDNCAVPLNQGSNDFSFWALSSWGDSSQMGTFSAKVDTIPPALALDITATNGLNNWYVSPTSITATGSDTTSGLSSVFLSVDNGTWVSSTTLNEGIYNINVQAEDNAGNISTSSTTILVDTTTPSVNVSLNGTTGNNGWYISSMNLIASATDATSGVASLESSLDGVVYQAYNSPSSFADGYHTIQFKAVDKAGNKTETSVQEFYVDTIAPAVDLPAAWEVGNTVTYKLQDDGSGLSAIRIVIEDEDEKFAKVAWDEVVSGNKFKGEITWNGKFKDGTIAPAGEYLVWVKVTDVAGNERIALGRVIVPEPNALFSLFKTETTFKGTPAPPQELLNSNANPSAITTLPIQSFGGLTTETKDSAQNSVSLVSGTASAGSATSSNPSTGSGQGVLWGATAAAMVGALTAYILDEKRKREEEQARESALQTQEAERRAKMKAQKMAKLEAQWAQEKMWEQARLEEQQQAKTQQDAAARMEAKIERMEAGEDAKWIASQVAIREQGEVKKKAEASQAGLAAYYNARKQSETSTQTQEKSWWQNAWNTTKSFVQDRIVQPTQDAWNRTITTLHNGLAWSFSNIFSPVHNISAPKVQMRIALDNDPPPSKWDQFWQGVKDWWNQPWFWEKQRLSAQTPTPDISAIQTQAVKTAIAQFTQTAQAILTPTPILTPTSTPTPYFNPQVYKTLGPLTAWESTVGGPIAHNAHLLLTQADKLYFWGTGAIEENSNPPWAGWRKTIDLPIPMTVSPTGQFGWFEYKNGSLEFSPVPNQEAWTTWPVSTANGPIKIQDMLAYTGNRVPFVCGDVPDGAYFMGGYNLQTLLPNVSAQYPNRWRVPRTVI